MIEIAGLADQLRALTDGLRAAGVERLQLTATEALLEGAGFKLLLEGGESAGERPLGLMLGAPEVAEGSPSTPTAGEPVAEAAAPAPTAPLPVAAHARRVPPPAPGHHTGRHKYVDGRCAKCGAEQPAPGPAAFVAATPRVVARAEESAPAPVHPGRAYLRGGSAQSLEMNGTPRDPSDARTYGRAGGNTQRLERVYDEPRLAKKDSASLIDSDGCPRCGGKLAEDRQPDQHGRSAPVIFCPDDVCGWREWRLRERADAVAAAEGIVGAKRARCPKCSGLWLPDARDEFGGADPHCVTCGHRPAREPDAAMRLEVDPATDGTRHRRPSMNGMKL